MSRSAEPARSRGESLSPLRWPLGGSHVVPVARKAQELERARAGVMTQKCAAGGLGEVLPAGRRPLRTRLPGWKRGRQRENLPE